jgi:hypothetical protein
MATRDPPDNVTPIRPVHLKKDGTPAKPTGFAKGGSHYKGPALGIPAGGIPASGIPAGGFINAPPGTPPAPLIGTPEFSALLTPEARLNRELAAEAMLQVQVKIALDPNEMAATRSTAADRASNRIEGAPVQRNINASLDDIQRMKDDELAAELEAIGRKRAVISS